MALKVALAKLPTVTGQLRCSSHGPSPGTSWVKAEMLSVPLGAGMRCASTGPRQPITLHGTVWHLPVVFPVASPQGNDGELSQCDGPMEGSGYLLEHSTPRPTCPLESLSATSALNLAHQPTWSPFAQTGSSKPHL